MSEPDPPPPAGDPATTPSPTAHSSSAARPKALLKIPPIPVRGNARAESDESDDDDDGVDDDGGVAPKVSPFGLNYIRTRFPSPLRFSSPDRGGVGSSGNAKCTVDQSSKMTTTEQGQ